jgi:hypothetical protein
MLGRVVTIRAHLSEASALNPMQVMTALATITADPIPQITPSI